MVDISLNGQQRLKFLTSQMFLLRKNPQVISHVSPLEHKFQGSDFKVTASQIQDTHNLMQLKQSNYCFENVVNYTSYKERVAK